jgi:hypothetical protein
VVERGKEGRKRKLASRRGNLRDLVVPGYRTAEAKA